jgi:hypothetical protein
MTCHFPRAHVWINVERVRASMHVDLLKHTFDGAFAFVGDSEGRIDARADLRRQIQGDARENQGGALHGFADEPRQRSDAFEQVGVKAGEALVRPQSVREVPEARDDGAARVRLGGQLLWLQNDPHRAAVGEPCYLKHAAGAALVRLTIEKREDSAKALQLGHEDVQAHPTVMFRQALDHQFNAIVRGHDPHRAAKRFGRLSSL